MSVRIVTDSTCDLPARIVAKYDIRVVPLHIHVGNREYLDGVDMTRDEFYAKLPVFSDHPTTAVPSRQKFHAIYDALADEGASEVLSIHISTALSAVADIARTAADETTAALVTVLDSRQLSLGTGFLVEKAAELANAGKTVKEILVSLEEQIKRTHVWAALDTLKYLHRSGRMNAFISVTGELLQIKPILKMYDGLPGAEKVRTRTKAINRLVDRLKAYSPFEKIAFLHSGVVEYAHALRDEMQEFLPDKEIWIEVINPVLGAHLGPGVVGFACVSTEVHGGI
ncbi:MAG: DegV family protein [Anaerolineales bacterium]|nr:DegV family protein [Anaerolineales bacterium]